MEGKNKEEMAGLKKLPIETVWDNLDREWNKVQVQ